jgi:hypothetical protein
MHLGKIFPALLTTFVIAFGLGCRKSEPPPPPSVVEVSPDTIARVHWLGKRRLDLEADAYYLSRVWSLPETARLQAQTFDRFSTGAWRFLLGEAAAAQIPPAVLRPLFDDLAQDEVYLEVRVPTNSQPAQACLAIHVPARRAGIWETNLAIAAELLAGSLAVAEPARHRWTIQRTNAPNRIALTRIGEWTVVGVGPEKNPLFAEITARILRDAAPLAGSPTNFWLEADFDPARFVPRISSLNHPVLHSAYATEDQPLGATKQSEGGSTPWRDEAKRRRLNLASGKAALVWFGSRIVCGHDFCPDEVHPAVREHVPFLARG